MVTVFLNVLIWGMFINSTHTVRVAHTHTQVTPAMLLLLPILSQIWFPNQIRVEFTHLTITNKDALGQVSSDKIG